MRQKMVLGLLLCKRELQQLVIESRAEWARSRRLGDAVRRVGVGVMVVDVAAAAAGMEAWPKRAREPTELS